MIFMVVAVARNGIIGKNGTLPWHIPSDLKRFKKLTTGHPIIMGRSTYESIGRALPFRTNIIVSKTITQDSISPDFQLADTINSAISIAQQSPGGDVVFVIGGSRLYESFIPHADFICLTEVDLKPDGDTKFSEDWIREFPVEIYSEDLEVTADEPHLKLRILSKTDLSNSKRLETLRQLRIFEQ